MTKKIIAFILALCILCLTCSVFAANNELNDSLHKTTNTVRNVVGGAENVVENGAAAIGNGVKDLGNTFSAGASRVTTDATNMAHNDGYAATRTANTGTFAGMNGNTWTWFILAIAALAIIGLVWYYAMQNKNEYNDNH